MIDDRRTAELARHVGDERIDALDVVRVYAALAEDGHLFFAEVAADDADDAHVREEARGQREVSGGAAQHPLARPERRLDRVERHGAYDQQ